MHERTRSWRKRWVRWRDRLWQVLGGVSVRTKILGIVLLMVVGPGISVIWQVRHTLTVAFREQLQQQGIAIARDVAARSTDLILINDLYALNRLLRDTQNHNPDVRYLFVLDAQRRVLAHTFGKGFPVDLLAVHEWPRGTPYHVQPLLSEEGQVWDVVVPIFDGTVGVVRVGLTEQRMWQVVNAITAQILFSLIAAFLIGIGAALVLTWILTRPILELVDATERVAQGDYTPRVRRWANDEIGTLADAFNRMVAQLAEAERERAAQERLRRFYLQRVIMAQEEERKRIARELHDELGQALAAFMVGLRHLEAVCSPEMRPRLNDLRSSIAATLERARRLAFDLRPSVLDDLGLVPALRRYIQDFQERFGIQVDLEVVGLDNTRLRPEVETTVYRIVQEALTNAAKYARCRHISVLLQAREHDLSVIVEDDGCGFDVENVLRQKVGRTSLGLYGMMERAHLIGGHLDIESRPGQGTTIYLRVPLDGAVESERAEEDMSRHSLPAGDREGAGAP